MLTHQEIPKLAEKHVKIGQEQDKKLTHQILKLGQTKI